MAGQRGPMQASKRAGVGEGYKETARMTAPLNCQLCALGRPQPHGTGSRPKEDQQGQVGTRDTAPGRIGLDRTRPDDTLTVPVEVIERVHCHLKDLKKYKKINNLKK